MNTDTPAYVKNMISGKIGKVLNPNLHGGKLFSVRIISDHPAPTGGSMFMTSRWASKNCIPIPETLWHSMIAERRPVFVDPDMINRTPNEIPEVPDPEKGYFFLVGGLTR